MNLVYFESVYIVEVWDLDALDKYPFPLTETTAFTEEGRNKFMKLLTSNKDALLNIKHRHRNIRILSCYKIKYKYDILKVDYNYYDLNLRKLKTDYWTSKRTRIFKKDLKHGLLPFTY